MVKFRFLLVTFIFLSLLGYCQTDSIIENLKLQLKNTANDSELFAINFKMAQHLNQGQHKEALSYASQSLILAKKLENPGLIAKANQAMGSAFFNQGNYNRAIGYYYEVLKYHEENKNKNELVAAYFNIALVYGQLKDNKKSQEYYLKALDVVEELLREDSAQVKHYAIGRVYNNVGITYNDDKDYKKALEYYHKAIKISEETNNPVALPFAYNNIGVVYKEQGDYQIALSFYNKSLALRQNSGDIRGLAVTHSYIAECYSIMGQKQYAINHYEKSMELCKKSGYIDLQRTVAEELVTLYAKTKNYKKSYDMHLLFKQLSDSININEGLKTASMLEMQYLFDKQQKEVELAEQKKSFRNLILFILLGAAVVVTSLLFFLGQSRIKQVKLQRGKLKLEKEKLEHELEYKNKELTTNVMYLVRKNELINSISSKLLDLKKSMLKVNQKPIQDIIIELQKSVDNDVWEEFEYRFKDVHEEFYKKLNEKFPDLTPNEKKLCAFLRLNMSTKEISAITFQTPHSITIARSRLRKKLNLTNQDINLVDFLLNIEDN